MSRPEPMQQGRAEFPVVADIEGGATSDGQFVLLQLLTADSGVVQFGLKAADLESFITFLLRIAAMLGGGAAENRVQFQPIPASSIAAGELADGLGCLGVSVGSTELVFQLPAAALSQIGQQLLILGAPVERERMS
jgi:hypothetical protein